MAYPTDFLEDGMNDRFCMYWLVKTKSQFLTCLLGEWNRIFCRRLNILLVLLFFLNICPRPLEPPSHIHPFPLPTPLGCNRALLGFWVQAESSHSTVDENKTFSCWMFFNLDFKSIFLRTCMSWVNQEWLAHSAVLLLRGQCYLWLVP